MKFSLLRSLCMVGFMVGSVISCSSIFAETPLTAEKSTPSADSISNPQGPDRKSTPPEKPANQIATHQQTRILEIPTTDEDGNHVKIRIHTFSVDADGRILCAAGGTSYQHIIKKMSAQDDIKPVTTDACIIILDANGKKLDTWKLDIEPQTLCIAPSGYIYVAGDGKICKLCPKTGKTLISTVAPHIQNLPPLPEIPEDEVLTEEQKKEKLLRSKELKDSRDLVMKNYRISNMELYRLKLKEEALMNDEKASQEMRLAAQEKTLEKTAQIEELLLNLRKLDDEIHRSSVSKRQQAILARNALMNARGIKAISATKDTVYLACNSPRGFGSEVWKADLDLKPLSKKPIIKNLSGCCGQMNINANADYLYVPENGRMNVVCFDSDGKQLCRWGKYAREAFEGFGSCCNPMNITFGNDGFLYTSEASVGDVKRFTPDGKFIQYIGRTKIVPGCKNTPIGISPDGNTFYVLDVNQARILVMEPINENKPL